MYQLGCIVVCVDIDKTSLKRLATDLALEFPESAASPQTRLFFYTIDVGSLVEVHSLWCRIRQDIGRSVNILINNAAVMNEFKSLQALSEEDVRRIFNVNIFSNFWTCKVFLPEMIEINKGHIVNVASFLGKYQVLS